MDDNDEILQKQFDKYNLALHIGSINKIKNKDFNSAIDQVLSDQVKISEMTNNCLMTFDGLGLERVCKEIIALHGGS